MARGRQGLGERSPRLDAANKVTGSARYASDIMLPGMLYGVVLRSEHPHAVIRGIDTTVAAGLDGVEAIVTAANLRDTLDDDPTSPDRRTLGRFGEVIKDQLIFAESRVRYIGEPIAAVAAVSLSIARAAAEQIVVDYEDLDPIFDPEEAMRADAPLLHEEYESYAAPQGLDRYGNVCSHVTIEKGDVEEAFRTAPHVFEDSYSTHSVHQCPMETRAAVADVDARGKLTVYASTQHPFGIRAQLAEVLGMALTDIRVITPPVGGGFGSKLEASIEMYAAVLARAARRPVKVVNTREEDLATGSPRHPMRITIKSALDHDGTILARKTRIIMDAGAYAVGSPVLTGVAANLAPGPYRIAHVHVDVVAVYTNKVGFGAYRGPTGPQTVFAVESHMDALARRMAVDPKEYRLKHILRDGEQAHNGQILGSVSLEEVVTRAAEAIGWGTPPTEHTEGILVGRGLSCGWWTTTAGAAACTVRMNEDGTATVQTGAAETGTGAVLAGIVQIVAAELGLGIEKVNVLWGDTDATQYDAGAQGSRTLFNAGRAARDAAAEVRQVLLERASDQLEVAIQDLDVHDGEVHVAGLPGARTSYGALMSNAMWVTGPVVATSSFLAEPPAYDTARVHGSMYPTFNSPSFHCHAAEVEVDPGTGMIRVTKLAVAQDVGYAVNPLYIEGQMQGGSAQGLGYALTEELEFDSGRIVNPNLVFYKLPTAADTPPITPIIVERPSASGMYGMKGVGEPPVIFSAAAIANAVYDATGIQIRETPLKPERVYRELQRVPHLHAT